MRKFLCALVLLLLVCGWGYGQDADRLFEEFKNEKKVEYVKVNPLLMSVIKMFVKPDEDVKIVRKVRSLKVMDLEDCATDVKERFTAKVNELNHEGYEELMRINGEGDKIHILMRMKKEKIREFLVLCSGTDECTLVQINGRFTPKDIDNLVNKE